jgi:ribosomal protein S20
LANTKSAQKQVRSARKRQLRNKAVRSQGKTVVLHPNNAARRKSRLVKKLNQLKAEPAAEQPAS